MVRKGRKGEKLLAAADEAGDRDPPGRWILLRGIQYQSGELLVSLLVFCVVRMARRLQQLFISTTTYKMATKEVRSLAQHPCTLLQNEQARAWQVCGAYGEQQNSSSTSLSAVPVRHNYSLHAHGHAEREPTPRRWTLIRGIKCQSGALLGPSWSPASVSTSRRLLQRTSFANDLQCREKNESVTAMLQTMQMQKLKFCFDDSGREPRWKRRHVCAQRTDTTTPQTLHPVYQKVQTVLRFAATALQIHAAIFYTITTALMFFFHPPVIRKMGFVRSKSLNVKLNVRNRLPKCRGEFESKRDELDDEDTMMVEKFKIEKFVV
ncbi:unnamed protein product [Amoebophrya sp. A120]|nr:unnamed protein product [Amoebophrya sp. A120]|eukprot:GSA120T00023638001.1